jgi:methylated-DNA-[protein]-cysteine S-methyltransferase
MVKHKLFNPEDFANRVRTVVRAIPKGQVMSYGDIAKQIGAPRYSRQVAKVMANNYLPDVPCHRVIRSDGKLGGYNRGGVEVKRALLITEGYTKATK